MEQNPYAAPDGDRDGPTPQQPKRNESGLPIWTAYIISPGLIVLFILPMMIKEGLPPIAAAFAALAGIVCAAILHAYIKVTAMFRR